MPLIGGNQPHSIRIVLTNFNNEKLKISRAVTPPKISEQKILIICITAPATGHSCKIWWKLAYQYIPRGVMPVADPAEVRLIPL